MRARSKTVPVGVDLEPERLMGPASSIRAITGIEFETHCTSCSEEYFVTVKPLGANKPARITAKCSCGHFELRDEVPQFTATVYGTQVTK